MSLITIESFDKTLMGLAPAADIISTSIEEGGEVHHIPLSYDGNSMMKVRTPICTSSGIYRNVDKKTGRISYSVPILLFRDWPAMKDKEKAHEKLWVDIHNTGTTLLDNNEAIKTKVGRPTDEEAEKGLTSFSRIVSSIVKTPKYMKGPNKGKKDTTRARRINPKLWTKKVREENGKKLPQDAPPKEDEMLTKFKHISGTPITLDDLIERPFDAVFVILVSSQFLGSKDAFQLKICEIQVCKLLEKRRTADISEDEVRAIQEEYASLSLGDADKPRLVAVGDDEGGEGDSGVPAKHSPPHDSDEESTPPVPAPKKAEKKEEKKAPASVKTTKGKTAASSLVQ